MTTGTKKTRSKSVFVTTSEKWQIAKFCIESKGVMLDTNGKFTRFRVSPTFLAEEINTSGELKLNNLITAHHIKISLAFHSEICELMDNKIEIPPQDNAIEEEHLKKISELQKSNAKLINIISKMTDYSEKIYGLAQSL